MRSRTPNFVLCIMYLQKYDISHHRPSKMIYSTHHDQRSTMHTHNNNNNESILSNPNSQGYYLQIQLRPWMVLTSEILVQDESSFFLPFFYSQLKIFWWINSVGKRRCPQRLGTGVAYCAYGGLPLTTLELYHAPHSF